MGSALSVFFTGSLYFGFARITARVFQMLVLLVAARILLPEGVGLVSIALLIFNLVETLSQLGINQTVIFQKTLSSKDISILWSTHIIRGLLGSLLILFLSPFSADFFHVEHDIMRSILTLFAIIYFIRSAINPGVYLYQRDLQFKRYVSFTLIGGITGSILAIILLWGTHQITWYIFGMLLGEFVSLIASNIFSPLPVNFILDLGRFKELYSFGKWVTLSTILAYLFLHIDDFMIGRLLGPSQLAIYTMAYSISQMPVTEGLQAVSQAAFPVFSKIKDNKQDLRYLFFVLIKLLALLSIAYALLVLFFVGPFVKFILGTDWIDVVPVAKVLIFWGVLHASVGLVGPLFLALNQMRITIKVQLLQTTLLLLLIYPTTKMYGLIGVGWLVFLVALLPNLYGFYRACILLNRGL